MEGVDLTIPTCNITGCDTEVPGLDDGLESAGRGLVCFECFEYHKKHLHWPDEDPIAGRRNHNRCIECEQETDHPGGDH